MLRTSFICSLYLVLIFIQSSVNSQELINENVNAHDTVMLKHSEFKAKPIGAKRGADFRQEQLLSLSTLTQSNKIDTSPDDELVPVYVTFEYNFNLNFSEQPFDKTNVLISQGYIPLLQIVKQHPTIKNDFFISGYTDDYLQSDGGEEGRKVIEEIKKGIDNGYVELGTYTYSHPILSLIPFEDVKRQLLLGIEADKRLWGITPKGLLLPEVSWDIDLPQAMKAVGLDWVHVFKEIVPLYKTATVYPGSAFAFGSGNEKIPVIIGNHQFSRKIRKMIRGEVTLAEIQEDIYNFSREAKRAGMDHFMLSIKHDAEVLYFTSMQLAGLNHNSGATLDSITTAKKMNEFYEMIESMSIIRSTSIGEYLEHFPPTRTIYAESEAGNVEGDRSLDMWLRGGGREKLNKLEDQARNEITCAGYIIQLAKQQGANTAKAEERLESAWFQLILAENSDGRGWNPHSSRKIWCATAAMEASRLAKEAPSLIQY